MFRTVGLTVDVAGSRLYSIYQKEPQKESSYRTLRPLCYLKLNTIINLGLQRKPCRDLPRAGTSSDLEFESWFESLVAWVAAGVLGCIRCSKGQQMGLKPCGQGTARRQFKELLRPPCEFGILLKPP